MFGTTAAEPLFAVELIDLELVRPSDGELKLAVVTAVLEAEAAEAVFDDNPEFPKVGFD